MFEGSTFDSVLNARETCLAQNRNGLSVREATSAHVNRRTCRRGMRLVQREGSNVWWHGWAVSYGA